MHRQRLLRLKQNLIAAKFALETNNSVVPHQSSDSTTAIANLTPNLLEFSKSKNNLSDDLWLSNDFTKLEPSELQKLIAGIAWLVTLSFITSLCIVEATEAQIFSDIPQFGFIITNHTEYKNLSKKKFEIRTLRNNKEESISF